ncbi:MAG: LemA family protein [Acidobacteria bacterium]|nr:LemA family protein [Acidobacteriota bacterium]
MKIVLIVLGVLLLIGLLFGGKLVGIRNDLVVQREAINGAWAQVDVSLQRRADLIPNLVSTVKGFAAQEKSVIDSVTTARAALVGARTPQEKIQANGQLDSALARLLVVVENYPNIKSNENFLRLQDELAGTENRIAVERRKYNETVQHYNTTIELFPNNLAAGLFSFQRNDAYFRTDAGSRQVPQVKF